MRLSGLVTLDSCTNPKRISVTSVQEGIPLQKIA